MYYMYLICYMAVTWNVKPDMSHTDVAQLRCEYIELRSTTDPRVDAYLTQRAIDLGVDETPLTEVVYSHWHGN